MLKSFLKNEDGATAVEYALIIAVVGVGILVSAEYLAGQIRGVFFEVGNKLRDLPMP